MFIYNNYDFTGQVRVRDVRRSIIPRSSLITSSILGRPGSFFFSQQDDRRLITVTLLFVERDPVELRRKIRDLAPFLHSKEPRPLIFNDEPDIYINAIVEGTSGIDEIINTGLCTLDFYCPDPYWYNIIDDVMVFNDTGTFNFFRTGTVESFPVFEITSNTNHGIVRIDVDGQYIEYEGSLLAGEKLVIDSNLLTAFIQDSEGSITPVLDKLSSLDFPVMQPGTNQIFIGAEGMDNLQTTIRANSRWL